MSGNKLEFVDTNILVYAHDRSAGEKHVRARALLERLWHSGSGCLSVQILQEFYVSVTRKVPKPLTSQTAAAIIEHISKWRIHSPCAGDVLEAIKIQQRYGISFWDAMVIRSAETLGCEVIWSEDLNPGQVYLNVKVINPLV